MKTIYIDTLQIHDYTQNIGYWVESPIEGVEAPEIRLANYDRSGEHGGYVSNQLYSGRVITLQGRVVGNTLDEFNSRRRTLEEYIRIQKDANSVPIPKTLKFTTNDNLPVQVSGYLKNFKFNYEGMLTGRYSVDFYCGDFALSGQTLKSQQILVPISGGFVLPVILPAVFGAQQGGQTIVSNGGTVETWPTIRLVGSLTSPIISNQTIGKTISLNLTIASGTASEVIINMQNKTIVQGSTPILDKLVAGFSWWWLEPGQNIINLQTGSTVDTGYIEISYRDAYLGV